MTAKSKQRLKLASITVAIYMMVAFVFWLPPVGMVYCGASLWTCHSSLKLIELQKMNWANETGAKLGDAMSESDFAAYFDDAMPRCPTGGEYSINKLGESPTCSHSDSAPIPKKKLVMVFFWTWEVMPAGAHEYLSHDSNHYHKVYQ